MIDRPLARLRGRPQPLEVEVDPRTYGVSLDGLALSVEDPWDVPTTGTVYGVALNYRQSLERLGAAMYSPPYKAPPKAPVLYIKPRNTLIGHGATVDLMPDVAEVALGPTLGIVIGCTATRVAFDDALAVVAGYTVVNDLALPHDSFYRPAIRAQCRDGFCPIGPAIIPSIAIAAPDRLKVRAFINGKLSLEAQLSDLVRPVARLLSDVTEFMTLNEGDVLLAGLPCDLPVARAGDLIAVEVDHVGRLENRLRLGSLQRAARP